MFFSNSVGHIKYEDNNYYNVTGTKLKMGETVSLIIKQYLYLTNENVQPLPMHEMGVNINNKPIFQ
jgi:hypothetical protein